MRLKLSEIEYKNILKKKRIRINGFLKSSLRKKSPEVSLNNFMKSDYIMDSNQIFLEYIKRKKAKTYQPKVLIFQILLNLLLLTTFFYFFKQDLLFEIFFISIVIFINWFILWFYSLISIIKNDFRKRSNKILWLLLIIFIPISAFLYPDFRRIQIEE